MSSRSAPRRVSPSASARFSAAAFSPTGRPTRSPSLSSTSLLALVGRVLRLVRVEHDQPEPAIAGVLGLRADDHGEQQPVGRRLVGHDVQLGDVAGLDPLGLLLALELAPDFAQNLGQSRYL